VWGWGLARRGGPVEAGVVVLWYAGVIIAIAIAVDRWRTYLRRPSAGQPLDTGSYDGQGTNSSRKSPAIPWWDVHIGHWTIMWTMHGPWTPDADDIQSDTIDDHPDFDGGHRGMLMPTWNDPTP
jgi:hypothetical protein